jgi:beta-glucosidase
MTTINIPEGFLPGAATSAYQFEGACDLEGRGPSIRDTFGHTPGKIMGNVRGDRGGEHYRGAGVMNCS